MPKKDFITSIALIVFSITVIVLSYTMPRLEQRGIDPFSAPGVVPGLIGGVLLCLALILFIRSTRRGGYRLWKHQETRAEGNHLSGAWFRVTLTLVISVLYAIGFLGRLNYSLATFLYVFFFIVLFEYQAGVSLKHQTRIIVYALIQAVIASLLITVIFRELFLVDLP